MRKRHRRILQSITLAALAALTAAGPSGAAAATPTATFSKTSEWSGGFIAQYEIRNPGPAVLNDWKLEFDLAPTTAVTSAWGAKLARAGNHLTATPEPWTRSIPPGESRSFGLQVAGRFVAPTGCRLNGADCQDAGDKPDESPLPPPEADDPPGAGGFAFAPYADMTLYPPFDMQAAMRASGVKRFTLAFVVSGANRCAPAWGGVIPLEDDFQVAELRAFRAAGGDAIVSFGGASGTELAQSCATADSLAGAYQAVIDKYRLTRIDFDVEGGGIADADANARRAQAIAKLQSTAKSRGRELYVSFTLPVLPQGLTADGLNLLRDTAARRVRIDLVNIMAMDYGSAAAPNPAGRMGQYAIDAANAVKDQLKAVFPGDDDAQLYTRIGVTPMIGVNDVSTEVFTLADADRLVAFAEQRQLGMLSMWSVARDKQCPKGASQWADATCSSILQPAWAFGKRFNSFLGG